MALGNGNKHPQIVGDFNDGGFASSDLLGNGKMRRIGTSQWFALIAKPPKDARFEYLIRLGNEVKTDSFNPKQIKTFGTMRSIFNGGLVRQIPLPPKKLQKGSLKSFNFVSKIRENKRTITVYLPPNYDPKESRLPTIYVKDGTRFLKDADLPSILDTLISQNRLPSVIAVFVEPINRGLEYGTYEKYRRFMVEELIPEIEKRFSFWRKSAKKSSFRGFQRWACGS